MSVQAKDRAESDVLVARARQAAVVLRANAEVTEQNGRSQQASLAAVDAFGGFALVVPRELGGSGADLSTVGRVLVELGAGCTSTAWVTGTSNTSKRFMGLGFDGPALAKAHVDPNAVFCGSGAPTGQANVVEGGVRVTGTWPVVSGCESATDAVLGVLRSAGDGSAPTYSVIHVPISQVTITRSWDTAGLLGTGSHTVVAENLFVPSESVAALAPTAFFLVSSSVDVLAPLIGAAQAALALTRDLFGADRPAAGPQSTRINDSAGARQLLVSATRLVEGAERRMRDAGSEFSEGDGVPVSSPVVARARVEFATAATEIREAMEHMLDLHGARGFGRAHPVQRHWRDISIGTRHPLLKPFPILEAYGSLWATPRD